MFSMDEAMAFNLSRAILKQALRDFHSCDSEKVTDVADWVANGEEFHMICESADIDPDYLAMFFLELSKRPKEERQILAENAISVLDSFSMQEPSAN
jgi:hypothetical protein